MGILTEEMKRAVPAIRLCFVATVSPDGKLEPFRERISLRVG
jgi:hypothetical protein